MWQHGTPVAKPQGGDRRSARIEDHAGLIHAAIERRSDITINELRLELAGHEVSRRAPQLAPSPSRFPRRLGNGCPRRVSSGCAAFSVST